MNLGVLFMSRVETCVSGHIGFFHVLGGAHFDGFFAEILMTV